MNQYFSQEQLQNYYASMQNMSAAQNQGFQNNYSGNDQQNANICAQSLQNMGNMYQQNGQIQQQQQHQQQQQQQQQYPNQYQDPNQLLYYQNQLQQQYQNNQNIYMQAQDNQVNQNNYNMYQGQLQNMQNQMVNGQQNKMPIYQIPTFEMAQMVDPTLTQEKYDLIQRIIMNQDQSLKTQFLKVINPNLIFSGKIHIYPFLVRQCKRLADSQQNAISILECGRSICINCLVVYLIKKTSYNYVQKLIQSNQEYFNDFQYFKIKCPYEDCHVYNCQLTQKQILEMIQCKQKNKQQQQYQ